MEELLLFVLHFSVCAMCWKPFIYTEKVAICRICGLKLGRNLGGRSQEFLFAVNRWENTYLQFLPINVYDYATVVNNVPHQVSVTHILKSSPACQNHCFFTRISTLQVGSSKIYQIVVPKVVIKWIHIMTSNNAMLIRALDFIWMFYRGPHMVLDSLPEESHPKSSHVARLGNNW